MFEGLFSLRPQTAGCEPPYCSSSDGLCRSSSPPGRALWVVLHLQATSQDAGLFVVHTAPKCLFCHLSETTPAPLSSPTGSLPHHRADTTPSPSSGTLPLSSGIGMEPGHPDFLMGGDHLHLSRASETPGGLLDWPSDRHDEFKLHFHKPTPNGVPPAPHLAVSSTKELL